MYDVTESNKTQSARDPKHMSVIKTHSNYEIFRIPLIQILQHNALQR